MLNRAKALVAGTGLTLAAVAVGVGAMPAHAMAQPAAADQPQSLETQPLMIRTQAGKQHFFTVEIADDPSEQRIGLMHRTQLGDAQGMIFVYKKPRQIGMWMKNTLISLDMLFLDRKGKILNVHEGAVPGALTSIRSAGPSIAVVEIAAGRAKALGIRAGDTVFHCQFKTFPCERSAPQ